MSSRLPPELIRRFMERARELEKLPMSMTWLSKAAVLPGKCLHVALAIQEAVRGKPGVAVTLDRYVMAKFGVSRDAGYDALSHLSAAGLIEVARGRGRRPTVCVLGPSAS